MAGDIVELPWRQKVDACIFDGCEDRVDSRGLCNAHYAQWRRNGELKPKRHTLPQRLCSFDGCDRKHARHGYCHGHSRQALVTGILKPIGSRRFKYVMPASGGYLQVFAGDHPNANKSGYIRQHVLVMSALLGRPLVEGENVHHKNGDRTDNRPENLELWSHSQPAGQRIEDKVAWAVDLLRTYAPELLANKGD